VLAALATATLAAVAAAGSEQAREVIREVQQVVLVEIPVTVTRAGDPVTGLSADDFEVFDRGVRREITGFEVVDLRAYEAAGVGPAEMPVSLRRHILVLFDQVLGSPHSVERARQGALDLVRSGLHPSDLVGVAAYTRSGVRLVIGFTSEHEQVARALERFDQLRPTRTVRDPLGIAWSEGLVVPSGQGGFGRTDVDGEMRQLLGWMEDSVELDAARRSAAAMTSALGDLARAMAGLNGRKHLLFLSEGFNSSVLVGRGVRIDEDRGEILRRNEAPLGGLLSAPAIRYGETEVLGQVERMAEEFVRAGVTVHSIDSAGLRYTGPDVAGTPRSDPYDALFLTADLTGGEFVPNYNRLDLALDEVMERTRVSYLLSIQPDDLALDGSYRRLEVKVKGGRRLRVQHRPGYHAPRPFGEQSSVERRVMTAGLILGARDGGQVATRVLSVVAPGPPASGDVELEIAFDVESLAGGRARGTVPAEFYAYALGEDGAVIDFFAKTLELDLEEVSREARDGEARVRGAFHLPPGRYTARTLVRNAATGSFGVRSTPFRVAG
jgi:VWFA-related protein